MEEREIRKGIDKFSLVYFTWTDYNYSEGKEDWDKDLEEHKSFINPCPEKWISMTINDELGGFGLDVNSLEELEELSKYFMDLRFSNQLRNIPKYEPKTSKRVWFTRDSEYLNPKSSLSLYLYPINYKKDYYRLREALLGLYKLGYLVYYENNKLY